MTDPTCPYSPPLYTSRRNLLKIATLVEGGMLVAAVVLGLLLGVPWWLGARAEWASLAGSVVAGAVLLVAAGAFMELDFPFTIRMRRDIERLSGLFRESTRLDFFYISILAGAGEEALFRGLIQTGISGPLGLPLGIAISALAFGLVHNISRAYVAFTVVLGVVFSGLYAWSGNIVVPMTVHAAYDFIALWYMRRGTSWNHKD